MTVTFGVGILVPTAPTQAQIGLPTFEVASVIRRDDKQGMNQAARMRSETLRRIGALAKYVLNVESQTPRSGCTRVKVPSEEVATLLRLSESPASIETEVSQSGRSCVSCVILSYMA